MSFTEPDHDELPRQTSPALKFFAVLALICGIGALYSVVTALREEPPLEEPEQNWAIIGQQLPTVEPLTTNATRLNSGDLAGKVVLLNFWGTWCGPCIREFPEIVALEEKFHDRADFRLVLISAPGHGEDDRSLHDNTVEFLTHQKIDLPSYADPDDSTSAGVRMLISPEQFGYPTTLVLDRTGVVRGYWAGYSRANVPQMERLVEKLLAEGTNKETEPDKEKGRQGDKENAAN